MGGGCFYHLTHLSVGSLSSASSISLFLELPLSFSVCTHVDMFNNSGKEGGPPSSELTGAPCSASVGWCA